jgi:mevalonate kinase
MNHIPCHAFQVLLVDSMLPKNTFQMIKKVRELHDLFPNSVDSLFDCIHGLVDELLDDVFENELYE